MAVRVFLTGATGFAGRHLTRLLREAGYEVFGSCFPDRPNSGEKNLIHLDLRAEQDVQAALRDIRPRWVFHLAAQSNVRLSWEKRRETMETNIMGTFHLLEAVRRYASSSRVLLVSSSDVYGILTSEERYYKEDDASHVVSPYGFTKVAGELLARFYGEVEKLDIVIARSFPHTGPGQTADFVFSDWASQIARIEKGKADPVIFVGNISIQRDYSDVRDVVRAYRLLMEKGRTGEVYNICSGKALSLQKGLDMLLALSKKRIEVGRDPSKLRKADIPFLAGDNTKIKKETGWQPDIPFYRTLADLLEYWRSQ